MDVALVTGGAGFIGSHLVKALAARQCAVRVLDNLSTGSPANLGRCARDVEMVVGALEDLGLVREMVEGVDVVFHLAAPPAEECSGSPCTWPGLCDLGTANVITACREFGVRRLVYASSTQVYGRGALTPRTETDPVDPAWPFAVAKLNGERSCTEFTLHHGAETVRLRYSNVFGPRQSPSSPYTRFISDGLTSLLAGQNPVLEGNGLEPQDLLFVDDAVRATLLAAEVSGISGRAYNIASGQATNVSVVISVLNDILGTQLAGLPTDCSFEGPTQNLVDISRARAELGFSPSLDLRAGLYQCVRSLSGEFSAEPVQQDQHLTNV